jgi:hypothetical protein
MNVIQRVRTGWIDLTVIYWTFNWSWINAIILMMKVGGKMADPLRRVPGGASRWKMNEKRKGNELVDRRALSHHGTRNWGEEAAGELMIIFTCLPVCVAQVRDGELINLFGGHHDFLIHFPWIKRKFASSTGHEGSAPSGRLLHFRLRLGQLLIDT